MAIADVSFQTAGVVARKQDARAGLSLQIVSPQRDRARPGQRRQSGGRQRADGRCHAKGVVNPKREKGAGRGDGKTPYGLEAFAVGSSADGLGTSPISAVISNSREIFPYN